MTVRTEVSPKPVSALCCRTLSLATTQDKRARDRRANINNTKFEIRAKTCVSLHLQHPIATMPPRYSLLLGIAVAIITCPSLRLPERIPEGVRKLRLGALPTPPPSPYPSVSEYSPISTTFHFSSSYSTKQNKKFIRPQPSPMFCPNKSTQAKFCTTN